MKQNIRRSAVFLLSLSLFLGTAALPAYAGEAAETKTVIKIFETDTPDDDGSAWFETELEEDGALYTLSEISVTLIETKTGQPVVYFDSPVFVDGAENHVPEEQLEKEDGKYVLLETELVDAVLEERVQYGEGSTTYTLEYIDSLQPEAEINITDTSSGQQVSQNLPLLDKKVVNEYWTDDFSFPVTVSHYGAEQYEFAGKLVPHGANLTDYADDFLIYLDLPKEYYRVDSIRWTGDPYVQDGVIKRDAVANGSKKMSEVAVVYGGEVLMPAAEGQYYHSSYRKMTDLEMEQGAVIDSEAGITYVMEGTAVYEKLKESTISFWQEIWKWILAHPVEVSCLLLLLLLIVILFVLRKRQQHDESEEDDDVVVVRSHGRLLGRKEGKKNKKKW